MTTDAIARRALADHLAAVPTGELLARYAARRDAEAFAGLVHQFAPLVLGVCRRVLGRTPDADDAFQAVFLALARQAGAVRDARALPAWLHRVALRSARKALARRRDTEPPADPADPADPFADAALNDIRRALDEELDALPEKYRGPVVLCWLDGLTQAAAADRLGLSLNTLKRRLDAGRDLLRSRLVRRGIVPGAIAAVTADPAGLRAVVPDALALLAVELGVGGPASPQVAALVVAVPTTGSTRRLLAAALALGVAATGGLALAFARPDPPPREAPRAEAPAPRAVEPVPVKPVRFEPVGPPLTPKGRLVRFHPDGSKLLVSAGVNVQIWEVATSRRAADDPWVGADTDDSFPYGIRSITLGLGGRVVVASHGALRVFRCWYLPGGEMREFELPWRKVISLSEVALSPDATTLATTDEQQDTVQLWDATPLRTPPPQNPNDGINQYPLPGPRAVLPLSSRTNRPYQTLAFSPDSATLATASKGEVKLWDVKTGKEKAAFPMNPRTMLQVVTFSPDGHYLAGGVAMPTGDDRSAELKVWDLAAGTGRTLSVVRPGGGFYFLAFHPDGRTLVSTGFEGTITAWDVSSGRTLGTLNPGDKYALNSMEFSPDGRLLATSGEGGVRLWRVVRE